MSTHDNNHGTKKTNHKSEPIDLTNASDESGHTFIDLTGSDDGDETQTEDEDEDLKLAIALSLQEQQPQDVVSVPAKAVQDEKSMTIIQAQEIAQPLLEEHPQHSTPANHPGLLGLDRKQMEAERMARLKRKRDQVTNDEPVSPPPLRRQPNSTTSTANSSMPTRTREDLTQASAVTGFTSTGSLPEKSSQYFHLQYPLGKVLLTSQNKSQGRLISLPDLLKPTEPKSLLKSVFLSTFIVDFEWLLPHFNTRTVSFVFALHAGNEEEKKLIQRDFAGIPNVRLMFPYVGGNVNCMHTKIMLLFYEEDPKHHMQSRCRIVVPSANLVPWDWGVGNVMENILFVIDLPLKKGNTSEVRKGRTQFQIRLWEMLTAMGTPENVMARLETFDFAETTPYRFVHTIGGSHILPDSSKQSSLNGFMLKTDRKMEKAAATTSQTTITRTGYLGLSDAVRSLGLQIGQNEASLLPKLDFVTSSLGNLKQSFMQCLFSAACGNSTAIPTGSKRHHGFSADQKNKQKRDKDDSEPDTMTANMTAYFPSDQTVEESRGGKNSAGTICFQSKWWDSLNTKFPKEIVSDCVGVRGDGILMHSKILFLRFARPKTVCLDDISHHQEVEDCVDSRSTPESPAATKTYAGWAYIGSANLSESAWGSLVTDSKTKQPKLNCRNWESGVLIPVEMKPEHQGKTPREMSLHEVFDHVVPVPMEYPGVSMVESGRRPWFFHG